jgi:hypothetical protein
VLAGRAELLSSRAAHRAPIQAATGANDRR